MRLVLTRPLKDSKPFKKKLEAQGHQVWSLPLIEIRPPKDGGVALQKACRRIEQYQWLVLTSHNAGQAVLRNLKKLPKNLNVVVVRKEGVADLIRFFKTKKIAGQKILYPISSIGRKELVRFLRKKGAKVDVVVAYQTKPAPVTTAKIETILKKRIEAVLFFSPSAVENFFKKLGRRKMLLKTLRLVPIGLTTGRAIKAHGYKPAYNLSGII